MVQFHIFHWRIYMGTDNLFHKRKQANLSRKSKKKLVLPYILIVCEGEKTEPNYFKTFKQKCKQMINVEVFGEGKNTESLVNETISIRNRMQRELNIKFDQVWCVFDKDSFGDEIYNKAFELCENSKINFAYSNECFELWYLLHFNFYNTGMTRKTVFKKLDEIFSSRFGIRYEKRLESIYELLECYQNQAIANAKRLTKHSDNCIKLYHQNPSTSVYKLVEELNKYLME